MRSNTELADTHLEQKRDMTLHVSSRVSVHVCYYWSDCRPACCIYRDPSVMEAMHKELWEFITINSFHCLYSITSAVGPSTQARQSLQPPPSLSLAIICLCDAFNDDQVHQLFAEIQLASMEVCHSAVLMNDAFTACANGTVVNPTCLDIPRHIFL